MQVHMKLFFAAVATGAGLVSAQTLSLSSGCSEALNAFLTSPDSACLNPGALLTAAVGSQPSIPDTINNWLTGLCSSGSCPDETLATIVGNLTTGCSEELAFIGATPDIKDQIIPIVQQVYPTVRKMVCLKDDAADQFCATATLNNVEEVIGTISLSDLSFLNIVEDARALFATGIDTLACTACTKEAYSIAKQDFPEIVSQIDDEASGLCGADFIDGALPEGISQTEVAGVFSATEEEDNGAQTILFRHGTGAALVLLAVSSLFALLG